MVLKYMPKINTKILVVDGDRLMRQFLKFMLTGKHFVAEEARDCREALEKISQNKPDMILADSGLKSIKKSSRVRDIPIIFCEKPYSFQSIYEKISAVFGPR